MLCLLSLVSVIPYSPFSQNNVIDCLYQQAYAAKQPEASRWSQELEDESNKLWHAQNDDTLPTIAALTFLIQSSGCNGNGELNVKFVKDTVAMAKRLRLFGCPDAYTFVDLNRLSEPQARATAQVAWGVFNTLR